MQRLICMSSLAPSREHVLVWTYHICARVQGWRPPPRVREYISRLCAPMRPQAVSKYACSAPGGRSTTLPLSLSSASAPQPQGGGGRSTRIAPRIWSASAPQPPHNHRGGGGRSTRIALRIWSASAPHPQGEQRALHEDPPQDLERQRSTPTGGAGGRSTRIPLRIWSASAPQAQGCRTNCAIEAPGGDP